MYVCMYVYIYMIARHLRDHSHFVFAEWLPEDTLPLAAHLSMTV